MTSTYKTYKVTFTTEMDEEDIAAMKESFCDAMSKEMLIPNCRNLKIEEVKDGD